MYRWFRRCFRFIFMVATEQYLRFDPVACEPFFQLVDNDVCWHLAVARLWVASDLPGFVSSARRLFTRHFLSSRRSSSSSSSSVALSSHRQVLLDFSQATLAVGRGLMQRRSVNFRYTQTLISEFNLRTFPLLHKSNVWQRGTQLTLVSLNTSFPVSKFYLDSSQQCR